VAPGPRRQQPQHEADKEIDSTDSDLPVLTQPLALSNVQVLKVV
jgi:hypothetical protein